MSGNDSVANSNGFVGGWTHLIPEESPVENVGPGDDGIESIAETPGLCEKVTWSATAPETGDWAGPPEGVESGEQPHDEPPPPEAPVESVGLEDAGRESPAEMPSFSEEMTGSVAEEQRGDDSGPAEEALSEEGLQVCQETTSEGSGPSIPTVLSPTPSSHMPLISDQESHAPFSMETVYAVTSPCSDTEGITPVRCSPDIYSHISSAPEVLAADSPAHDDPYTHISSTPEDLAADSPAHDDPYTHISSTPDDLAADSPAHDDPYTHISSAPEVLAADSPAHDDPYTHISSAPEDLAADSPAHDSYTHSSSAPESIAPVSPASNVFTDVTPEPFNPVSSAPDAYTDLSPALEAPTLESQYAASVPSASVRESQEGEEPQKEEEVSEPAKILADVVPQEDLRGDSGPEAPSIEAVEGDGLRRRHVPLATPPEPLQRGRDEEEEEEEEEFHLIEKKKEEGAWISLNKCIVGALVLLCLGSIIFTEEDSAQPRDPELQGKQEWLNPDAKLPNPQEVSQLLGKLAEENQQMAILQAQLQTQKEELGLVLQKGEPPTGQTENHTSVRNKPWEELREAAVEEGDTGLEEEKTAGGQGSGAMEEEERRAGREGERKRQWMGRVREVRREGHQEKEWKKGREEWEPREERKEKKGENNWKHWKDGGKDKRREWKEKVERRRAWETGREWLKGGEKKGEGAWKAMAERKDQRRDGWRGDKKEKDWKALKEGWKVQRGWREEQGMVKDKSKKEKPWQQGSAAKKPRAVDQVNYWKRQRERLWKHRPPVACEGVTECAGKDGLMPVQQAEFRALLGSYLEKLGDDARERKDTLVSLVGEFFADDVFSHDRVSFREFAEDVEEVLEDLVEGDRQAEDEMEKFEREALRRFAVGGGEREGRRRG